MFSDKRELFFLPWSAPMNISKLPWRVRFLPKKSVNDSTNRALGVEPARPGSRPSLVLTAMGYAVASLVLLPTLGACSSPADNAEVSALANTQEDLAGRRSGKWPNAQAIPICFVEGNGTSSEELHFRHRVVDDYAQAGIGFKGWNRCEPDTWPAIRVLLRIPPADIVPFTGASFVGRQPGTKAPDGESPYFQPGNATLWIGRGNIDHSAIHEIGHSIGMDHEHQRSDSTGECRPQDPDQLLHPNSDFEFITDYDPESVMGYCRTSDVLSTKDIEGLRAFYDTTRTTTDCYWLSNTSGTWLPLSKEVSRDTCREMDSCSPGGGGSSNGGCYKWAVGPEAAGVSWP